MAYIYRHTIALISVHRGCLIIPYGYVTIDYWEKSPSSRRHICSNGPWLMSTVGF